MQSSLGRDFLLCTVGLATSFSHMLMRSYTIQLPRSSSCSYASLTDFPRHNRSPTTQVSRLAADWQPRSSFCPTVGTSICLALCLRHSGTVIEPGNSATCGFVSWSNAACHGRSSPCPSLAGSPSDKDGTLWATRHKTQPGVYPFVTCTMSGWVGWLAVTELGTSAKRANRRYMRAMGDVKLRSLFSFSRLMSTLLLFEHHCRSVGKACTMADGSGACCVQPRTRLEHEEQHWATDAQLGGLFKRVP